MDNRPFVVFDFETGSVDTATTQILQIGACAVNRRTLDVTDTFQSLVRPEDPSTVEPKALEVNGLTLEQLADAPVVTDVFPLFATWIQRHNTRGDKSTWGAPTPITYNGANFDMPIFKRYAQRFGYWDAKWQNQTLLNPVFHFDVFQHMWYWFHDVQGPPNLKLTSVLAYMGMPQEEIEAGAHDALWDCRQTAMLAKRLLELAQYMTANNKQGSRRLEMKGCLL